MSIVGGLDVHRRQITFNYVDTETGQVMTGRIAPADRPHLRAWLAQRFAGGADVHLALEAGTGWRYVAEEIIAAGFTAHLAEPTQTAARRGRKRKAKTDLLTELPAGFFGRCVRGVVMVARFRPHDQRRGRAAGVVRVGGAAARLA